MAKVFRFIFRLDFDPCFEIADHPGTIMSHLSKSDPSFWSNIGASNQFFQITANRRTNDKPNRVGADMTIELTSISSSIEFEQGISLNEFWDSHYLRVLETACSSVMERFQLRKINRCGARFFLTSEETDESKKKKERYFANINAYYVPSELEKSIEISDFSLTFVGQLDHDLRFRLVTGPYEKNDRRKYFTQLRLDEDDQLTNLSLFSADVDLFQEKVNFTGTTVHRWLKAKHPHLDKMIKNASYVAGR
jgi:hypothetical protein